MKILCDYCGIEFTYKSSKNKYNKDKNHYCSRKCACKANNLKLGNTVHGFTDNGITNIRYGIWKRAKARAKKKGVEFTLNVYDIPIVPLYCPVLGIEIHESLTKVACNNSPSIDRIDSNKGYINGNIRIISNRANTLKNNATLDELELIVEDAKRILINDMY